MDFARLYTLQGTTHEEFDRITKDILAMADNERDTHFAGFAHMLFAELRQLEAHSRPFDSLSDFDTYASNAEILIAQRAYDLVEHVMSTANERMNLKLTNDQINAWIKLGIPDLIKWPDLPTAE